MKRVPIPGSSLLSTGIHERYHSATAYAVLRRDNPRFLTPFYMAFQIRR